MVGHMHQILQVLLLSLMADRITVGLQIRKGAQGAGYLNLVFVDTPAGDINPDLGGKVFGKQDRLSACYGNGAFESINQLTHVAGPGVGTEHLEELGRKFFSCKAIVAAYLVSMVLCQQGDVLRSLLQAGEIDHKGAESEQEISPERALLYHLVQVAVGGSHQPEVAGVLPAAAQGAIAVFL